MHDFEKPCPHAGLIHEPHTDHHPLTQKEVEDLLDFIEKNASGHDWKLAIIRLTQAIPGMVCPLDFAEARAIKRGMQLLRLLTTNRGKGSTPEMVASVMKLIQ